MISGQMYFHRESKKSVTEIIKFLVKIHKPEDVKYVLVNPVMIREEIDVDNIKIKPNRAVLTHHFWFIQENNIENRPKYANFEK